ncbi:hypothetical protein HDF18_17325 [Mucilaginibacter sp. X5P1]|uniref:hypothetical protein n=1 Tax=Mucilaginibacter sp. X5P1 TaxID=2723088 RepID=UPI0016107B07|nr:hypothetical protein [Mucilaginibacter sp. X5P1]MBB6139398.1 hypothetical protein [Mucilaginibacter sp. X5P1]
MKNLIITLFLLTSSLLVEAQQNQPSHAQPDSVIKLIPYGEGRQAGYLYTIGGKLQTPDDVKMKLLAYAPSADEYHKARNSATWVYISTAGFAITSTVAIFEYAHNSKTNGATTAWVNGVPTFEYPHHSYTSAYIFTGLATAFITSTIINLVHASKHAKKALDVYNQRFE